VADAEGERGAGSLGEVPLDRVAIGPASGFDPSEREALRNAGFTPICLASARLRTETAAVAWASLWAAGEASAGRS
jgi:hypothetical protein